MASFSRSLCVGIVGARGYSGMELVRLLNEHPLVSTLVCFTSDETPFSPQDELLVHSTVKSKEETPHLVSLPLAKRETLSTTCDVVFLATPPEVSIQLTPAFLKEGAHVIDISGAYRLNETHYPEWYGFKHEDRAGLQKAHYGLVPFASPLSSSSTFNEVSRKEPKLISNPGCFVTSVLMALIPLLNEKVISPDSIVIDSKSGTTGAGKKAAESILFSEVSGDCTPYKIGKHQHYPEIVKGIKDFTGVTINPFFTTQLLSVRTGILSSIYATLPKGKSVYDVADAYKKAYENYPLVRYAYAKEPRAKNLLSLRRVSGTPYTNIVYEVTPDEIEPTTGGGKLYLYSVIDNLLKGAASQAIENFNKLYQLPVHTGLI